jgi:hypothetical protein
MSGFGLRTGMKKCPFCIEEIPEESKVCKFCNSTVVKKCPFCAEEIAALAKKCRFCQSDLSSATGESKAKPSAARLRSDRTVGEERGIALTVLLTLLTCGIYGIVVQYKIGEELNRHQGRNQINAGMDLLLLLLTCGVWGIYLMYKYPRVLQEITIEEEVPVVDIAVPCILLSIFGLHIVALAILQSELNRHWEGHRTLRASGL